MRILAFLLALTLGTLPLPAEPELKGTPAELVQHLSGIPKSVQVIGEAEIKVQADRAIVTLKVVTEDRALEAALRSNQSLRARSIQQLGQAGVAQESISANRFSSTPKYAIFSDKAKTYKVENSVKITVQDEKQFQAVAKLVDANPEIHYLGVDFEHSAKKDFQTKVLTEASQDAVSRKRLFEETLGVRLTPLRFTQSVQQPIPLGRVEDSKPETMKSFAPYGISSSETATPAFGEMTFKAFVTVEYALSEKK